jgi:glycosyltransferase involved in cell wall biosynthesis
MKRTPFMSIVVISYNGASTIERTLISLLAQQYPKERYEIIVIDDGSTDSTAEIVSRYPVRYHHQTNGGISSARNTGIALAGGDIYVCMDDDCQASPNLLKEFATAYQENSNVIGVGGIISDTYKTTSLTDSYICLTGSGLPPQIQTSQKRGLNSRTKTYVLNQFAARKPMIEKMIRVEELFGANGSYLLANLRAINGWDVAMSGIEDRDICRRLRNQYPAGSFYVVSAAKITHDPDLSLSGYLLRPWKRGPVNLQFHQRYRIAPPVFPYPILVLITFLTAGTIKPALVPFVLLMLPQLLYSKWPILAFSDQKLRILLFPYLQLAEESMVILGILRGYLKQARGYRA